MPIFDDVIVAADDNSIVEVVKDFGGNACLTPEELTSGTDRVAYVTKGSDADVIVNVQCDEPFIRSEMIDVGLNPFVADDDVVMGSLKTRISDIDELLDPNVVKVVTDNDDDAIYFSRSPIPFNRDAIGRLKDIEHARIDLEENAYYKHLGIYYYRPEFLQKFSKMPAGRLEVVEKLEQLRVLENGYKIKVPTTKHDSIGVDTKEDLIKVRNIFLNLER